MVSGKRRVAVPPASTRPFMAAPRRFVRESSSLIRSPTDGGSGGPTQPGGQWGVAYALAEGEAEGLPRGVGDGVPKPPW